jgi:hypothetical protein
MELPEVAAAAARMMRGVGKRAASDPAGLPYLAGLRDTLDEQLLHAIDGCRQLQPPMSWAEIGRELGVTAQAVQQWHARRVTRAAEPAPV